jgi:hypothetical protein
LWGWELHLIWTDRAAIGVAALLSIGAVVGFGTGTFGPVEGGWLPWEAAPSNASATAAAAAAAGVNLNAPFISDAEMAKYGASLRAANTPGFGDFAKAEVRIAFWAALPL